MFFLGVVVIVCILKYPFNYKNDDKNYPIRPEMKRNFQKVTPKLHDNMTHWLSDWQSNYWWCHHILLCYVTNSSIGACRYKWDKRFGENFYFCFVLVAAALNVELPIGSQHKSTEVSGKLKVKMKYSISLNNWPCCWLEWTCWRLQSISKSVKYNFLFALRSKVSFFQ